MVGCVRHRSIFLVRDRRRRARHFARHPRARVRLRLERIRNSLVESGAAALVFRNGEWMNDFLSSLMARSFTDAPVIQPRLPSLFETSAAGPLDGPQIPAGPGIANEIYSSVDSVAPPLAQNIRIAPLDDLPKDKNTSVANGQISEPLQPRTLLGINAAQTAADSSSAIRPATSASPISQFSETSRTAKRQTPPTFERPSSNLSPTINVTIGRVEVRAIQSPAPIKRQAKAAPPKLSLANYLQKSAGGAQ